MGKLVYICSYLVTVFSSMYPLFLFLPLQTADWGVVPSEGEVGPTGQEKSEVPENPEIPPELPSSARSVLPQYRAVSPAVHVMLELNSEETFVLRSKICVFYLVFLYLGDN